MDICHVVWNSFCERFSDTCCYDDFLHQNIWVSVVFVHHSFMTLPLCNDERFVHVNEPVWLTVMLTSVIVTLNTGMSICVLETWYICVLCCSCQLFLLSECNPPGEVWDPLSDATCSEESNCCCGTLSGSREMCWRYVYMQKPMDQEMGKVNSFCYNIEMVRSSLD